MWFMLNTDMFHFYSSGSGRVVVKQLVTQFLETSETTTKEQPEQQNPARARACARACAMLEEEEGKCYVKQN